MIFVNSLGKHIAPDTDAIYGPRSQQILNSPPTYQGILIVNNIVMRPLFRMGRCLSGLIPSIMLNQLIYDLLYDYYF